MPRSLLTSIYMVPINHAAVSLFDSSVFLQSYAAHPSLHSFPTRRSSDLADSGITRPCEPPGVPLRQLTHVSPKRLDKDGDRKSTRLNSSHLVISYAVFCLKKKKNKKQKKEQRSRTEHRHS